MTEPATNSNGNGNGNGFEKKPLQSKKFVAYLIAEATWKALCFVILFKFEDKMPINLFIAFLTIICVAGFIEVGYILGEANLDKFTRLAQIAFNSGKTVTAPMPKGLKVEDPKPEPEPPPAEDHG